MTISELIAKLESVKQEHGDLPCVTQDQDGYAIVDDATLVQVDWHDPVPVRGDFAFGSHPRRKPAILLSL